MSEEKKKREILLIINRRAGLSKETYIRVYVLLLYVAISSRVLKPSCSWALHTGSINVIFFDGLNCLVLRATSYLDAFSTYSPMRSCSACHMTTDTPEASEYRSSRTRYSFHSDNNAPSRYHTNCLAYLLNDYFDFRCVDYTFTLPFG